MKFIRLVRFLVLVCFLIFPLLVTSVKAEAKGTAKEWTDYGIIAHEMGGIDGKDYSNSYDAFLQGYQEGFKVFESDLLLTSDEHLVARHDWYEYLQPSLPDDKKNTTLSDAEFIKYKIYDKYTPMDFNKIIDLLISHPDIYLVTDTKEIDAEVIQKQFEILVNYVTNIDVSILDRIIPEIYTHDMYKIVNQIHHFKHQIYSIYLTNEEPSDVLQFAINNHIQVVAMPLERATKDFLQSLNKNGILPYLFTSNDMEEVIKYKQWGAKGFYTDFLFPADLEYLSAIPQEVSGESYAAIISSLKEISLAPAKKELYQQLLTLYETVEPGKISVFVNGNSIDFKAANGEVDPVIVNERVLVPIRQITEALGAKVDWDSEKKMVNIKLLDTTVQLLQDSTNAKVNGQAGSPLDVPITNINDHIFVPLRYIVEQFSKTVEFIPGTNNTDIISIVNKSKNTN